MHSLAVTRVHPEALDTEHKMHSISRAFLRARPAPDPDSGPDTEEE